MTVLFCFADWWIQYSVQQSRIRDRINVRSLQRRGTEGLLPRLGRLREGVRRAGLRTGTLARPQVHLPADQPTVVSPGSRVFRVVNERLSLAVKVIVAILR